MADPFVDEFLFRGHGSESGIDPAWLVVMATEIDNGFGGRIRSTMGPLNMAQAAEKGFTLPVLIADMNSQAMALSDTNATRLAKSDAENDLLRAALDEANKRIGDLGGDPVLIQLESEGE